MCVYIHIHSIMSLYIYIRAYTRICPLLHWCLSIDLCCKVEHAQEAVSDGLALATRAIEDSDCLGRRLEDVVSGCEVGVALYRIYAVVYVGI